MTARRILTRFVLLAVAAALTASAVAASPPCRRKVCGEGILACQATAGCKNLSGKARTKCNQQCVQQVLAACAADNTVCVPTTTTTTSTTTTTTFVPVPCGEPGSAPPPLCWGECPPEAPICAVTANGCECVAGSTPCGSATFPACDGACPPGKACLVSLSVGCTCDFVGIPCSVAFGLTGSCTNGVCPGGEECVFVSTPDGDGCICNPIGSTCLGSPGCGGTCPSGQTCGGSGIPGLCRCS